MYIVRREEAKRDASLPPAPGLISMRQGRWAKGCWGTREDLSFVARVLRVLVVELMSDSASWRSSLSEEGSLRRAWSSSRDCRDVRWGLFVYKT